MNQQHNSRPADDPRHEATTLSAEQARQGHIALRTPLRRAVFLAGVVGIIVVLLLLAL